MKINKKVIILILLIIGMFVFIPKSYAGGGMFWDVSISDDSNNEITARDGIIGTGDYVFDDSWGKLILKTDDFNEYIEEINKYLPQGVTLKANTDKTYDVYIKNVKTNNHLSFYGAWSGNIYLSGENELNYLELYGYCKAINIIGEGSNNTILKEINIRVFNDHKKTTFKDCNIQVKQACSMYLGETINVEGKTKLELPSKSEIRFYGEKQREALINFIGEQYNSKYETGEIEAWGEYCSPDPIIIKNYDEVKLLEQSVEKIKGGEKLTFRFDEEVEKFEEVYVNEKLLKKDVDYTIKSGSTIVELSEEYTKTLKKGKYEVKAMFTKGMGVANFEILEEKKTEEPQIEEAKTEKTKKENTKTEKELDNTPKTGTESCYISYYTVLGIITTIISGTTLKMKKII